MPTCGNCKTYKGTATEVVAHQRAGCTTDPAWRKVAESRADGKVPRTQIRRLLGVQVEPMSEEKKEYLKNYSIEHKDDIKRARKNRKALDRLTQASLAPLKRGLKRRG